MLAGEPLGERKRPRRAAAGASRRKTPFGGTPNSTRGDAYAPRLPKPSNLGEPGWYWTVAGKTWNAL